LVPFATLRAVPIQTLQWYRLHRYEWYRYSATVIQNNYYYKISIYHYKMPLKEPLEFTLSGCKLSFHSSKDVAKL